MKQNNNILLCSVLTGMVSITPAIAIEDTDKIRINISDSDRVGENQVQEDIDTDVLNITPDNYSVNSSIEPTQKSLDFTCEDGSIDNNYDISKTIDKTYEKLANKAESLNITNSQNKESIKNSAGIKNYFNGQPTGFAVGISTLNTVKYQTAEYLQSPVIHELEKATGAITDEYVALIIDGDTYYYTPGPEEDFGFLQLIASFANAAIVTTDDPSKAMYRYQGTMYTHDMNELPLSVFDSSVATSSDYNYMAYSTDSYGNKTYNYYNIDLKPNRTKLKGLTWERLNDGSDYTWDPTIPGIPASEPIVSADGRKISGAIRFNLPKNGGETVTHYYKYSYDVPSDYEPITSRTSSISLPGIIDKYYYGIDSGKKDGNALIIGANAPEGSIIKADFIANRNADIINNDSVGTIFIEQNVDKIEGNFIGNKVRQGAGIEFKASTKSIVGNFIANSAAGSGVKHNGGAINAWNGGVIDSIYGSFFANTGSNGGAINNGGTLPFTIKVITGDFVANRAKNGNGGAIYNANIASIINAVTGDFISNSATSNGGAIANIGIIRDFTGDFIGNSAKGKGGAIYSETEIRYIVGDYIGNTAAKEGGAIYNQGIISNVTSDFIGNISSTKGGAIYNKGNFRITAETSDLLLYDNKDSTGYNDVYQLGTSSGANLYINASEGHTLDFNGTIAGAKTDSYAANIKINDSTGYTGGKYTFNNTVSGNNVYLYNDADVNFGSVKQSDGSNTYGKLNLTGYELHNDSNGGTINSINDNIENHNLGSVYLNSTLKTKIDLDLENNVADTFTISGGSDDYAIKLNDINFLADDFYAYKDKEKTIRILRRENDNNTNLTLDPAVITPRILGTRVNKYLDIDSLDKTWGEKYEDVVDTIDLIGLINTSSSGICGDNADSITYKITEILESSDRTASSRDTLAILNQTEGNRSFTATNEQSDYHATENLGETAAGTLTITGVEGSIHDLNLNTGFELKNETTLNLNSLSLKSAGSGINILNPNAVINLNNTVINSDFSPSTELYYSSDKYNVNTSGNNTINASIFAANINNTGILTLSNINSANIQNSNILNTGEIRAQKDNVFKFTTLTNNSDYGTLNLQTNAIETQNFDTLTLNSDMNFRIDVDLANTISDKLTSTTVNSNGNNIILDAIYIMTEDSANRTAVTLTEDKTNFENLINLSNGVKIETKPGLKSYGVAYSNFGKWEDGTDSGYDSDKGILIFDKLEINTLADAVANTTFIRSYTLPDGNKM